LWLCAVHYSVDATEDNGTLGRLVNHSKRGLARTRVVVVEEKPHLCLFATDDMIAGQQVLFDYGLKKLPFEDKVC